MPVFNKKQEFEQRKLLKLFDDFSVRAYRFDFASRTVDVNSPFSGFQFSAFFFFASMYFTRLAR